MRLKSYPYCNLQINWNFSTADLYQFTTGTLSERFQFILWVAVGRKLEELRRCEPDRVLNRRPVAWKESSKRWCAYLQTDKQMRAQKRTFLGALSRNLGCIWSQPRGTSSAIRKWIGIFNGFQRLISISLRLKLRRSDSLYALGFTSRDQGPLIFIWQVAVRSSN